MSIEIAWADTEKTIIRCDFIGEFTWDELDAMNREATRMLDSVEHTVDFITDISHVKVPGDTLSHYSQMVLSPVLTHPNAGLAVITGTSSFTESLLNLFPKVYRQMASKLATASTPEEAYQVIAAHRGTG